VGPRESNRERKHLAVAGPSAISDAVAAARKFAADSGLLQPDAAKLAIVIEELVTNLYDHGGLSDDDSVAIELSASADAICLRLSAPGSPFHPGAPLADAEVPERGGGAGLKLVQAWSVNIDHSHNDGRNQWLVVLPLSEPKV
jgi:anti-sigma regulatory factor (Ser/Thr protein kinase)